MTKPMPIQMTTKRHALGLSLRASQSQVTSIIRMPSTEACNISNAGRQRNIRGGNP